MRYEMSSEVDEMQKSVDLSNDFDNLGDLLQKMKGRKGKGDWAKKKS